MASLQSSLQIMKRWILAVTPANGGECSTRTLTHCHRSLTFAKTRPVSDCIRITSAIDTPLKSLRCPHSYVFNRSLKLDLVEEEADLAMDPSTTKVLTLMLSSACVVLNLALVHHRLGVQNIHETSSCSYGIVNLVKAENMYKMVLQLLQSHSLHESRVATSIRIISLNNLVALHQELLHVDHHHAMYRRNMSPFDSVHHGTNDAALMVVYAQHLQEVVALTHETRYNDTITNGRMNTSLVSDFDLRRFEMNIELWKIPGTGVAPAA